MIRCIVAGSRHFDNYPLMERVLDKLFSQTNEEIEIISGCQVTRKPNGEKCGADYFGEVYAETRGYPVKHFPADWSQYGKKAGRIRNEEMAKYGTHSAIFWDEETQGLGSWIISKPYISQHKLTYSF
jgi:hypothetical protein